MADADRQMQPVFILSEGSSREAGRGAQRNNILAAKLVAETVRTTLGPKGMDKMLVDSAGDVTVTNDGVTILEEMDISHPAARMVVEVARTQEDEVGDGTTTAVVLAGEFLKNAEKLLDDKVHPTVVIKGYRLAEKRAQQELAGLSEKVSAEDTAVLRKVAETAMTGKGAENAKELLSSLTVDAVTMIADDERVPIEHIKITSRVGGSIHDSELIEGLVLDKERVHPTMPERVDDARILLIDIPIEIQQTELDTKINISDPDQLQTYLDMEERMLDRLVDRIATSGATAVFCQKGVDDTAAYHLAKNGIAVYRRIRKSDMETLSRATGARILSDLQDIQEDVMGGAASVTQRTVGEQPMVFIEGCKNAKAVTLLVRGGTQHVVDEVRRAVTDAVGDVRAAIRSGAVVGGAGSVEMLLSAALMQYARTLSGREQLAVEAYASALEVIPRTLAENAGLDPIDVIADLKSASDHTWSGIDVFSGAVVDAWEAGVIEPLRIKTQALSSATDVAAMILRIDDVISADRQSEPARDLPSLD